MWLQALRKVIKMNSHLINGKRLETIMCLIECTRQVFMHITFTESPFITTCLHNVQLYFKFSLIGIVKFTTRTWFHIECARLFIAIETRYKIILDPTYVVNDKL